MRAPTRPVAHSRVDDTSALPSVPNSEAAIPQLLPDDALRDLAQSASHHTHPPHGYDDYPDGVSLGVKPTALQRYFPCSSPRDVYKDVCRRAQMRAAGAVAALLPGDVGAWDTVTALDLGTTYVGPRGVMAVVEVCRLLPRLHTLSAAGNFLTNGAVCRMCAALRSHPALRALCIARNDISWTAGVALADLAARNRHLTAIDVSHTLVPPHVVDLIEAQTLANSLREHPEVSLASRAGCVAPSLCASSVDKGLAAASAAPTVVPSPNLATDLWAHGDVPVTPDDPAVEAAAGSASSEATGNALLPLRHARSLQLRALRQLYNTAVLHRGMDGRAPRDIVVAGLCELARLDGALDAYEHRGGDAFAAAVAARAPAPFISWDCFMLLVVAPEAPYSAAAAAALRAAFASYDPNGRGVVRASDIGRMLAAVYNGASARAPLPPHEVELWLRYYGIHSAAEAAETGITLDEWMRLAWAGAPQTGVPLNRGAFVSADALRIVRP